MSVPARVLNDLFSQKLGTSEGKEKIAEYAGTYIRDRLREVSFARKSSPRRWLRERTANVVSIMTPW